MQSVRIGPAERVDVIIDFRNFAGKTIYLENRLNQLNGQGPAAVDSQVAAQNSPTTECSLVLNSNNQPAILPAGAATWSCSSESVARQSPMTASIRRPIRRSTSCRTPMPHAEDRPHLQVRPLEWPMVDQRPVHGLRIWGLPSFRFTVQQNSVEQWLLTNLTGDWTHPVHIHLEEHQILTRNRVAPTVPADMGRKDVTQLHPNERVQLFFRFRDWLGKYPIHCHNVVHEDHAMMALWHVRAQGDNILVP